ncbi:hypothetical protein [Bosea beijingensis]|uniref:hypothetical protein n=1 Tax=Bosea beijingensis TaxID=3068632 RepID=UPI0027417BEF|nr:hypothetical protein [Bosea sp. REN20]
MSEIIAKLHRRIETIAARRKPQLLLLVMLCFATASLWAQPGAKLIAIILAAGVVLASASLTVDGFEALAAPTTTEGAANGMLISVLSYFAARDLVRAVGKSITIPVASELALISFIQSYGIALFIISSACAVTAFVSRQLDWTRS